MIPPPKARGARREKPSLDSLVQDDIAKLVKLSRFEPVQHYWLDTGSPELNAALGSRVYGIPYGRIIELRGVNHGGKTLLSLILAGMAQKEGAGVGYIDVEQSRDQAWAEKYGLVWRDMVKIYPKMIARKAPKHPRLETAEELFAEAEVAMAKIAALGYKKQFWILDSVAMLRTKYALQGSSKDAKAGKIVIDRNMRANMDRAAFLSDKLPEWAGIAAGYNATIILINQMRKKPGVVYGDPAYSPGGSGMEHACAVRAGVRRIKNGRLLRGTSVVGILSLVENFKNKAGRGCIEKQSCAIRVRYDKDPARVSFMTREEAEESI